MILRTHAGCAAIGVVHNALTVDDVDGTRIGRVCVYEQGVYGVHVDGDDRLVYACVPTTDNSAWRVTAVHAKFAHLATVDIGTLRSHCAVAHFLHIGLATVSRSQCVTHGSIAVNAPIVRNIC
jgi:hypothetical protein